MSELTFEPGKYYKRRDGLKSLCVGFDSSGKPVFEDPLFEEEYEESFSRRDSEGFLIDKASSSTFDIIGPWQEPRTRAVEVCMFEDFVAVTPFVANADQAKSLGIIARKTVTITEDEGMHEEISISEDRGRKRKTN